MSIQIQVRNKVAVNLTPEEVIICGNSGYTLEFLFDDEWASETVKTARFVYRKGGQNYYEDVAFSGNTATAPVLSNINYVLVGVYTGDLITSTPAVVACDKSILCGSGTHKEPTPDVYNQLIELINAGGASDEKIAQAVNAYLAENPVQAGATAEQAAQIAQNKTDIAKKVSKSGWGANKYLGTDANGNVVETEAPEGGTVTDEQIADAVEEYMNEHPVEVPDVDLTGVVKSVNGKTPDANGNVEITVSGGNINPVPKTDDMTQPVGVDANGRLWVAPIGGGSSGGDDSGDSGETEPTTHGIVWNLVNVTSSNSVASVNDGASLSAVLTASDGYTLGDVTVTMGGEVLTGVWDADTATVTIASVTGDVIISCAGVVQGSTEIVDTPIEVTFVGGTFTGANGSFTTGGSAARISHVDLIDGTTKNVKFVHTVPSEGLSNTNKTSFRIFLFDADGNYVSNWNLDGTTDTTDSWRTATLDGSEYVIPAGHKIRFVFGQSGSNWTNNASMGTWANTEFKVYYTEEVAVSPDSGETTTAEESSVMMLSFNRVYVDSGEYTEDMLPKWDGMFSIHRGMSTAPDNTLQAIWEAKKHGYNCCELDVRYTSDNQVVLCHDTTVTGTVDGVEVTYTVAETDLATLQTVCVGDTNFPDAMVCSLEDAMRLCRRIGMRPEIDYKVSNDQIYQDCVALSMKYGLQDDTLHCCYGINYAVIVKTAYEKANLRVDGSLLDSDSTLDTYLTKPGNLYAFYAATACGKTDGSNVGANVDNETRILTHKAKGYKMYVWNVTPYLLPDVMQWEPDILQPQSAKDGSDWYTLIRELNSFDGLVF